MYGQLVLFYDQNSNDLDLWFGVIRKSDRLQMDQQAKKFGFVSIFVEIIPQDKNNADVLTAFQSL